ncbi:DUF1716-domain-containing protein [Histomonas meleagridis]|uniref:DUF1716-domain-containing protein n=1 Tax=Histomonas meleagridis TaxID=135588 RepID=UPI00355A18A4|nr:DUF1716-domain-containing protein [Histomonas meleagridis]KAH0800687.1 DUF1716-domain-containing protein [Histomonas meleagridis]
MALREIEEIEEEPILVTEDDLKYTCNSLLKEVQKIENIPQQNNEMISRSERNIINLLTKLQECEGIDGFNEVLFESPVTQKFSALIQCPNTEISSLFISILTDVCENTNSIPIVKRGNYLEIAISRCVTVNFIEVQPDAQLLYGTFNLIATILDGCEDAPDYATHLLQDTEVLSLIEKQFIRDDFDENVLAATETLAILLQIQPSFISKIDIGLVNLLVRFCANLQNPKSASEIEAAHNAFNSVILIGLDEIGNEKLVELRAIDILLNCWTPHSSVALLAIRSVESVLSASKACCEQFIEGGGIKKLFSALNDQMIVKSQKFCVPIVGILDSLLTILDTDSTYFMRVMRKFEEKECEKVERIVQIAEFLFDIVDEKNPDSLDNLQLCCCIIMVIFGYGSIEIQTKLIQEISDSESIDFQLVVDSAELRIDEAKSIADRVRKGIEMIQKVVDVNI